MNGEVQTGRMVNMRGGVHSLAEQFVKRIRGGEKVWNNGLGDLVKEAIDTSDLPGPTPILELARTAGILPRRKGRR